MDSPAIETVLPSFLEFVGDGILVAHNADLMWDLSSRTAAIRI